MAAPASSPHPDGERSQKIRDGKRRRTGSESEAGTINQTRRRTACQSCRARKVKCDNVRPVCALCRISGSECEYVEPEEKLTLESATKLMMRRMDQIQRSIDDVNTTVGTVSTLQPGLNGSEPEISNPPSSHSTVTNSAVERSRDYLQIPPHKTSSDTVLTWPVFEQRYPANYLVQVLFTPSNSLAVPDNPTDQDDSVEEAYTVAGGLRSLEEERIPALIDNFLQNVHTKNPVLDVESLVRRGRLCAEQGLGWDAWSCLVLMACALGCIAKPFDIALPNGDGLRQNVPTESLLVATAPSSAQLFAKDLQAAESCFVLALRRLGLLRHTLLGAQCHFFAGVYLMYTLRPLLSWSHFHHASIYYQLHLKSTAGMLYENESEVMQVPLSHLQDAGRKQRRLEQSLYWSCFKSESEFRVELPLPQSEIAQYDYPNLFPSPPSPPSPNLVEDARSPASLQHFVQANFYDGLSGLTRMDTASTIAEDDAEIRQHAKKLCNEEESWYYYLTEVALRRIGNRIINTFFRQDHRSWIDIKPLISIALEFDAQVSTWSAHLPPAMQHYESASSIRAPNLNPLLHEDNSFVSRELSWATDNRILEMRSWLYQPFLYYLIHSSSRRSSAPATSRPDLSPSMLHHRQLSQGSPLVPEDTRALHSMITAGIECNLKIMDVRSLRHRHHGLWYDLRSTMCASLILMAIIKSGHIDLIPGGIEALYGASISSPTRQDSGPTLPGRRTPSSRPQIGGRLGKVLDSFEFWANECPEMYRHRDVLHSLALTIKRDYLTP